jgi:CRISPR system Cascade subunit CasA
MDGKNPQLASLNEIFTAGEDFSDLAVRPHERVSLMRLFLCVAHAALNGPKDYDEWCKVPGVLGNAVSKYLKDLKSSFELFHPTKPWLQIADISKSINGKIQLDDLTEWTPVSKLCFSYASGNNTTLFDHEGINSERSIPIEKIILSMLTFQCFSPGGLISQVFWCKKQSGKTSKDSPCVPASMVHAFLRGNNLLATIHLNLPVGDDIHHAYKEIGHPVWEMMPSSYGDSINIENATKTYIGRLVPLARLILLHPTAPYMLLGDGLSYPTFTDGFQQEPTATVVIHEKNKKEERVILSYRPIKSIWRELGAIIVKRNAYNVGGPLTLRNINERTGFDLTISALARDKATIVDTVESVINIPPQLITNEGQNTYDTEVKIAERISGKLGWAIEGYREEIDGGWDGRLKNAGAGKSELKAKLRFAGSNYYWTSVEKNLSLLMAHIKAIGTDEAIPTQEAWRKMLFSTACEAYKTACGQETPRQIKAFVKGWRRLTSTKEGVDEGKENIKEDEE